ncbi:hypothetical protein SB658_22740, partial [Bacillus sp. SIMBA_008]
MTRVAPEDNGAASGLVNTAHQLGGTIGLALLTVVFTAAAANATTSAGAQADAGAYAAVFQFATWFYVLAVVIAAVMVTADRRRGRLSRRRG